MKKEFEEYLEKIGITELFFDKAVEVLDFYEKTCSIEITDIFVSDYVDHDGERKYESMWLFSPEKIMEAKNFLNEDNFDAATTKNNIIRWELKKTEYDFLKTTRDSRMSLVYYQKNMLEGSLKASQDNCAALYKIFLKYILSNMCE